MTTRLRTRIRRRRLLGEPVQPARLGLDHGWSWFMPSFLALGRPWLLVDRQLVGDGPTPGLERLQRDRRLTVPHGGPAETSAAVLAVLDALYTGREACSHLQTDQHLGN